LVILGQPKAAEKKLQRNFQTCRSGRPAGQAALRHPNPSDGAALPRRAAIYGIYNLKSEY
jgi:hypothetical protein